jgi:integrase
MAVIIKGKNPRKPHTVRYWAGGKQRERSFATAKEARDFMTQVEYESRTSAFVDPKRSSVRFADYAVEVIAGMAVGPATRATYQSVWSTWLAPWAGDRSLKQIAEDREGFARLVNRDMTNGNGLLSYSRRNLARIVLVLVLKEAIRAGRLDKHRLGSIRLVTPDDDTERSGFVFPTYQQIENLSVQLAAFGPVVWLMRGCGLRPREALGVHREYFIEGGATIRLPWQSSVVGDKRMPLKHRKPGDYRDIPVPGYLWRMIEGKPNGPLCAGSNGSPYPSYNSLYFVWRGARKRLGLPDEFVPHSLRHAFVSALLASGVPITDVAVWLGHRDISITYEIYAHLIPSAAARARSVLDDEFKRWSHAI